MTTTTEQPVAPVISEAVIDAIVASLIAQHTPKLLPKQLTALEAALKRAKVQMLRNRPFMLDQETLHVQSSCGEVNGESVIYECTLASCECIGFHRRRICWHRAFLMILLVAQPLGAVSTVVAASPPFTWVVTDQLALAA